MVMAPSDRLHIWFPINLPLYLCPYRASVSFARWCRSWKKTFPVAGISWRFMDLSPIIYWVIWPLFGGKWIAPLLSAMSAMLLGLLHKHSSQLVDATSKKYGRSDLFWHCLRPVSRRSHWKNNRLWLLYPAIRYMFLRRNGSTGGQWSREWTPPQASPEDTRPTSSFALLLKQSTTSNIRNWNAGQCPTWWSPCRTQVAPSVQRRKVWLTATSLLDAVQ